MYPMFTWVDPDPYLEYGSGSKKLQNTDPILDPNPHNTGHKRFYLSCAYVGDEDLPVLVEAAVELGLEHRAEEGEDQLVRIDPLTTGELQPVETTAHFLYQRQRDILGWS